MHLAMHRYIKALDTVITFLQHQNLLVPGRYSMEKLLHYAKKGKRKADYVTTEDEQSIWNNGVLGSSTVLRGY